MAHEYSVHIHDWLKDKINKVEAQLKNADSTEQHYYSGQLEQLREIRQYLTDRIDLDTQQYY